LLGPDSFYPLQQRTWTWAVLIWVLSIGSAWVVHRWFEKPMMNLRDRGRKVTSAGAPGDGNAPGGSIPPFPDVGAAVG